MWYSDLPLVVSLVISTCCHSTEMGPSGVGVGRSAVDAVVVVVAVEWGVGVVVLVGDILGSSTVNVVVVDDADDVAVDEGVVLEAVSQTLLVDVRL
jgi:hypothetical protein